MDPIQHLTMWCKSSDLRCLICVAGRFDGVLHVIVAKKKGLVATKMCARDLDLGEFNGLDGRRLEVIMVGVNVKQCDDTFSHS